MKKSNLFSQKYAHAFFSNVTREIIKIICKMLVLEFVRGCVCSKVFSSVHSNYKRRSTVE